MERRSKGWSGERKGDREGRGEGKGGGREGMGEEGREGGLGVDFPHLLGVRRC